VIEFYEVTWRGHKFILDKNAPEVIELPSGFIPTSILKSMPSTKRWVVKKDGIVMETKESNDKQGAVHAIHVEKIRQI
jgi:hypothetical protein